MDPIIAVIEAILGIVIAIGVGIIGYRVGRRQSRDEGAVLRAEAERTLTEAQAKARELLMQNKDEVLKLREAAERETKERRLEVQREEERQVRRRSEVDAQRDKLEQREKRANTRQAQLDKLATDVEKLQKDRVTALERIAAMTRDEARGELLNAVREETRNDMARVIRETEAFNRSGNDSKGCYRHRRGENDIVC